MVHSTETGGPKTNEMAKKINFSFKFC